MSAAVDIVATEFVVLAIICLLLVRYYKSPMVTTDVTVTVYLSWVLGLAVVMFLPYDLSVAFVTNTTSSTMTYVWSLVYWVTYLFAWLILPLQMEYHSSGHFTFIEKLKDAVWKNILNAIIGIIIGVVYVMYMVFTGGGSISQVIGFMMAIGNTYAVVLIVLLMGNGLAELPKRLMQMSNNNGELQRLYISACPIESAFQDARYELEDCELEVTKANEVISANNNSRSSFSEPNLHIYITSLNDLVSEFQFHGRSSTKDYVKKTSMALNKSDASIYLTKLALVDLRARLLRAQVRIRACERRWFTLINSCHQYEDLINGGSGWLTSDVAAWCDMPVDSDASHQAGFYQILNVGHQKFSKCLLYVNVIWMRYCHKYFFVFLSGVSIVASILILWSELLMASSLKSPLGLMMGAYETDHDTQDMDGDSTLIQAVSFCYIAYMSICTYWSLFRLNLGWQYSLQGPQQSTHASLIFNGQYFSRLQFAMGYNFLLILNASRTSNTAFNSLMANMQLIPVFGTSFTIYGPLVLILVSIATLFNAFSRLVRWIGIETDDVILGNWFYMKNSLTDEEKENLDTGRSLINHQLKQLAHQRKSKEGLRVVISPKGSSTSLYSGLGSNSNNNLTSNLNSPSHLSSRLTEPLKANNPFSNTPDNFNFDKYANSALDDNDNDPEDEFGFDVRKEQLLGSKTSNSSSSGLHNNSSSSSSSENNNGYGVLGSIFSTLKSNTQSWMPVSTNNDKYSDRYSNSSNSSSSSSISGSINNASFRSSSSSNLELRDQSSASSSDIKQKSKLFGSSTSATKSSSSKDFSILAMDDSENLYTGRYNNA